MTNRYIMTRKDNIALAKRNIVDSIWKSANLEGIAVTFPEVEIILENLLHEEQEEKSETNDMTVIKQMIFDSCIDGIDFHIKENSDLIEFEKKLKMMKKSR